MLAKWTLGANGDGTHRLVLVPGKTRTQVNEFVANVQAALTPAGTPKQRTAGGADRRNIFAGFAGEPQR